MRPFFCFCLLLAGLCGQSQQLVEGSANVYEGKLRGKKIILCLHQAGHKFFGYYLTNGRPEYLTGEDSTVSGRIKMTGYLSTETEHVAYLTRSDEQLKFAWKRTGASPTIDLRLISTLPFLYASGKEKLRPAMKGSPAASFAIGTVWPDLAGSSTGVIRRTARKLLALGNADNIDVVLLRKGHSYFSDYKKELGREQQPSILSFPSAYEMDESAFVFLMGRQGRLTTLAHVRYTYTGGAHGFYKTDYVVLDTMLEKRLRLGDVLTHEGVASLGRLLENAFRREHALGSGQELTDAGLLDDAIPPTSNFFVTNEGIGFSYAPYEIAPYAMGEIQIVVSYGDLKKYLTKNFRRSVARFAEGI
jgi:Protein of unknown function (DUF3298)